MIDTACVRTDQYSILSTQHSALNTRHSAFGAQCTVHSRLALCDVSYHLLVLCGARSRRNTDTDTDTDTDEPPVLEARTWFTGHGPRLTAHG